MGRSSTPEPDGAAASTAPANGPRTDSAASSSGRSRTCDSCLAAPGSHCAHAPDCSADVGRSQSGWIARKHDCMDVLNHDPSRKDDHTGTVWRCECGKAYRVHGFITWRLRRYDAAPDHASPSREA